MKIDEPKTPYEAYESDEDSINKEFCSNHCKTALHIKRHESFCTLNKMKCVQPFKNYF